MTAISPLPKKQPEYDYDPLGYRRWAEVLIARKQRKNRRAVYYKFAHKRPRVR